MAGNALGYFTILFYVFGNFGKRNINTFNCLLYVLS